MNSLLLSEYSVDTSGRQLNMVDPLDDLLNLEEQYYEEGYQQGYADGLRQSKLEAKLFGIEKGFEKFLIMGKLQARAQIWHARLLAPTESNNSSGHNEGRTLPPLQNSARIEKHLALLLALVDPATLSLANTDDAVANFDDRLKRAQAKEKIIEKVIGEDAVHGTATAKDSASATGDMESFARKLA